MSTGGWAVHITRGWHDNLSPDYAVSPMYATPIPDSQAAGTSHFLTVSSLSSKFWEISFFLKTHCLFIYHVFSFDSYLSSLSTEKKHTATKLLKKIFLAIPPLKKLCFSPTLFWTVLKWSWQFLANDTNAMLSFLVGCQNTQALAHLKKNRTVLITTVTKWCALRNQQRVTRALLK